jgi:hypothetical protein
LALPEAVNALETSDPLNTTVIDTHVIGKVTLKASGAALVVERLIWKLEIVDLKALANLLSGRKAMWVMTCSERIEIPTRRTLADTAARADPEPDVEGGSTSRVASTRQRLGITITAALATLPASITHVTRTSAIA